MLVVTIWAVPLLLAPPLFSRDVYTYAAQGEMMSHHINPYSYGPEVLGATPFNQMADSMWSGTESPYGPTFLSADGVLDQASGHQILPDLVLLRLLEVGGIAMMVAATPDAGPGAQTRPGACRPDRGGLAPRAAVAGRRARTTTRSWSGCSWPDWRWPNASARCPGVILCALAAGVKSPAPLGVLFLGWVWAGPGRLRPAPHRPHGVGRAASRSPPWRSCRSSRARDGAGSARPPPPTRPSPA